MANDPPKINPTGSLGPGQNPQDGLSEKQAPSDSFKSLMGQNDAAEKMPSGPSPMELASQGKPLQTSGPTSDSVMSQMNSTSSVLGDINNQLSQNPDLKKTHKYILNNKLTSANQNIRAAAEKAGVSPGDASVEFDKKNPMDKFVGLISDSQNQLMGAQGELTKISQSGQTMNPGALLTMQVKLSKAQQELEYSSVLLSQVTSGIKTMFNIQF